MVRVFSSISGFEAHFLRGVLEAEGIEAELRQESLAPLAGAVPLPEVMVELWVPAEDAERAQAILARGSEATPAGVVHCGACGEENPRGFELCWSCQGSLLPS